ncbi:MAG: M20/M25/M40 family metallo-hydrolase, partial [Thermoanaerobaculia bacterium]
MWGKPLIHERRGAARLALYLTPVVLSGLLWALVSFLDRPLLGPDMLWGRVDYADIESVQLLHQFLQFDTTHPHGNEIPAAEFLARHLESAGIPARVERLGSRNANVWGILEGEDPRALVLHNHLDTDPVRQPELWRYPPFSGKIDPPFIYGRGAFDMKSYAIAQLMSLREIARSGRRPRRSLIFLATGQEEIDSRLGTRWILRNHPELAERFAAVITEGGAVEAISVDKVKYWGTEIAQKRFIDIWVCDADRQRLEVLRRSLIQRQPELRPPSEAVARFFRTYSGSRDHHVIRRLTADPDKTLQDPEVDFLPRHLKALLRNEI